MRAGGSPAGDFAPLVNVSKHTLYVWKQRFEAEGPAGLLERPRGAPTGSRLPEITKRAILMMKQMHPDWGVDRISDLLLRTQALQASPSAIATVLTEDGYLVEESRMQRHPDKIRFFERANPNQMWQSDLFTFTLKRQNQRVYLVAFMDDHSRYIVSYGLHASQSAALVLETLRAGIASYGTPQEILTDNGTQYVTWRGTSQFSRNAASAASARWCRRHGTRRRWGRSSGSGGRCGRNACKPPCSWTWAMRGSASATSSIGIISRARTPALKAWCRPTASSAPRRRCWRACGRASPPMRWTWRAAAFPRSQLYLAGNVGGMPVTLHGEGDRVILSKNGQRAEVDFEPRPPVTMPAPTSAATPPVAVVTMPTPGGARGRGASRDGREPETGRSRRLGAR